MSSRAGKSIGPQPSCYYLRSVQTHTVTKIAVYKGEDQSGKDVQWRCGYRPSYQTLRYLYLRGVIVRTLRVRASGEGGTAVARSRPIVVTD